ncbi:dTDP-4-dehydrorhamnose 3,5-epimerase [Roseateles aquatilis]|uniref:dTDP-4-dehydrorhamnose 3,5-epimerase n=1 Tax=Roseateles aquatilis TaxID=431061 RepID=A0A246JN20_9BURK|nr:dTDP-4-dehydrorhamnose 3,5-epimerase [Roseateles aquatilis]OWQ93579.1 dTDP-4-dehydrorhamnose 3,5-epimerase [Roseateles aquatilis]
MNVIPTALPEVLIIEPKVFGDARGFFMESWTEPKFNAAVGHDVRFVQDNHSRSGQGVLRGLHFQLPPHAQGKLVRCTSGAVFDVTVDMRKASPNFGKWAGVELSGENHRQLWIPPGFAHGFLVLTETADFLYKTTDTYAPQAEGSVRWNDPAIGIVWPTLPIDFKLADKDANAPLLAAAKSFD